MKSLHKIPKTPSKRKRPKFLIALGDFLYKFG